MSRESRTGPPLDACHSTGSQARVAQLGKYVTVRKLPVGYPGIFYCWVSLLIFGGLVVFPGVFPEVEDGRGQPRLDYLYCIVDFSTFDFPRGTKRVHGVLTVLYEACIRLAYRLTM